MNNDLRVMAVHAAGIARACADAGVHEQGNNAGIDVSFYLSLVGLEPGNPWCCAFFVYCDLKAWMQMNSLLTGKTDAENRALMLHYRHNFSADTGTPLTGSCQAYWDAMKARQHGRDFNPAVGDAVLYNFGEGIHHIGRALDVLGSGRIRDCEGNTSGGAGSIREGDGVYVRERPRAIIAGFVAYR